MFLFNSKFNLGKTDDLCADKCLSQSWSFLYSNCTCTPGGRPGCTPHPPKASTPYYLRIPYARWMTAEKAYIIFLY